MSDTGGSRAVCFVLTVAVASSASFVAGASFVARLCATGSGWFLVIAARVDRRAGAIVVIRLVNRNMIPLILYIVRSWVSCVCIVMERWLRIRR